MQAHAGGASFEKTLTLGRQHYFVSRTETRRLLREFGRDDDLSQAGFPDEYPHYAEPFWNLLGVSHIDSMDASGFEGATIVHDLNTPLSSEYSGKYDAVCDVGTLEHVFNVPVAFGNCMRAVRKGGRFYAFTPANNYFGHGFYQFSAEFFFSVFSEVNGYRVDRVVACEYGMRRRWFSVSNPAEIQSRVALINRHPVLLFIEATRIDEIEPFSSTPQQSDYMEMWGSGNMDGAGPRVTGSIAGVKRFLLDKMPLFARSLEAVKTSWFDSRFSFGNRKLYSPVQKNSQSAQPRKPR